MSIYSFPVKGMLVSKSNDVEEINVLDTNGCSIISKHKGNIIHLKKHLFKCLILNNDTAYYTEDYKCDKSIEFSKQANGAGFNKERIFDQISAYPVKERDIGKKQFYYFKYPLIGKIKDELIDTAYSNIKDILIEKVNGKILNGTELVSIIEREAIFKGYIIVPLILKFGYFDGKKVQGDLSLKDFGFKKFAVQSNRLNKVIKCELEVAVIDIAKKEVILKIKSQAKEGVLNSYSTSKSYVTKRVFEKVHLKLKRKFDL